MDMKKSDFLNGDLKDEVYTYQSRGFQVPGREHLVCRLKTVLNGMKQALNVWYIKIDNYLNKKHQFYLYIL